MGRLGRRGTTHAGLVRRGLHEAEGRIDFVDNEVDPATGTVHPERGGKVFWTNPDGYLCHRFSFRKMDMAWSEDSDVRAARDELESLMLNESEYVIEGRLESGLGLVSNNVLHTREKLVDSEDPSNKRLLFRTRFYDRVNC
mgnify:CR=1 FL=1